MNDAMKETRRQEPHTDKGAPRLPRHVEDFLGQVLRNRFHDTVLSPLPDAMTRLVEAMRQEKGSGRVEGQD